MKNTKYKILNTKYTAGFTLIELLVVGVIVILIAVFVVRGLSTYRNEQTLRTESLAIVSIINEARSKTLSSVDSSAYGVHLEDDGVTLFKGTSYDVNDSDNEEHILPNNLEIGDISINGGSNIVFERLTGETSNYGTFDVMQVSDNTKLRTISVVTNGQINSN